MTIVHWEKTAKAVVTVDQSEQSLVDPRVSSVVLPVIQRTKAWRTIRDYAIMQFEPRLNQDFERTFLTSTSGYLLSLYKYCGLQLVRQV